MKAVVIGGGIAGLVAANEFARGGAQVKVLEAASALGGRASTDDLAHTRVNRGPHALYRAGEAMRILRELGVKPQGATPDLHRFDIVIDGVVARGPTTPWATASASYLRPADKIQLAKFLGALFRLDPKKWDDVPFATLQNRYADSEAGRKLLRMMATISTFGASPWLSAGTALRQIRISLSNVLYLQGGWQSLIDQLAAKAVDRGVTIHTNHAIRSLEELDADVVVLAVGPDVVESLTGVSLGERKPTTMATFDFVMPEPPKPARNTFDMDRGIFLSFHPADAGHCAMYLDPDNPLPAKAARREIESLLDQVQPGWRQRVRGSRFLPRIRVNEWFPDARTAGQAGRPPVRLDERTFVVGDWVGPHGLLADAACHSAQTAARLAHPARKAA